MVVQPETRVYAGANREFLILEILEDEKFSMTVVFKGSVFTAPVEGKMLKGGGISVRTPFICLSRDQYSAAARGGIGYSLHDANEAGFYPEWDSYAAQRLKLEEVTILRNGSSIVGLEYKGERK